MQTLISVFDDRAAARRAIERLVDSGFARQDLHLQEPSGGWEAAPAADAQDRRAGEMAMQSAEREVAVDRGVLESIGRFFTSLMGKDHDRHSGTYAEALRRGGSVVVVDAPDSNQAAAAAAVLHDCGAVDVTDRAKTWRDDGWQGDVDTASRSAVYPGVHAFARTDNSPLRDHVARRRAEMDTPPVTSDAPATTRYANVERPPETLEDRAGRVATERAFAFGDSPRNELRDEDGKPSRR